MIEYFLVNKWNSFGRGGYCLGEHIYTLIPGEVNNKTAAVLMHFQGIEMHCHPGLAR